jgi:hypothetical protein
MPKPFFMISDLLEPQALPALLQFCSRAALSPPALFSTVNSQQKSHFRSRL